jgi:hypothetical protein
MDRIQATPRVRPVIGGLADMLAASSSPERTQQMQGLMQFLQVPEIAQTLDRISYGEPITTGRGMTTALRPEAKSALGALLGLVPIGRAAEPAAMAAGRAGERVAERVVPQVMERGGLPAEMLGAMAQGTQSPATVFHGSPHLFQRFDASKIGTGEGAQVYGHGLYFAESPEVADQYRKTLAHKAFAKLEKVDRNSYKVTAPDGTVISEGLPLGPSTKAKSAFDAQAGNLYQVDLPDEQIARMLDFDKPLSQQVEFVRRAIQENELDYVPERFTGGRLIEEMNKAFDPAFVSQHLRQAGIPGIRYLDQGSRSNFRVQNTVRGKPYGDPVSFMTERQAQDYIKEQAAKGFGTEMLPGTSNFVVFPGMEDMLRIEQINEQPIQSLFQTLGR